MITGNAAPGNETEYKDISSELDYTSTSAINPIVITDAVNDRELGLNRKFYSTTSSVYAEHTISNPNCDQILFCISVMIQAQIFEDLNVPEEYKGQNPEFDVDSTLLPIELESSEVLVRESENDIELCQQLRLGNVPTLDTIYRYIRLLKERSGYPAECNIIALIYTNRITSMSSIPLTMQNWRAIWVVAAILAQKMWDDKPLKTSAFVQILPYFSKPLLRDLELKSLILIQFCTGVKPSLYAQYYFELRSLFQDINPGSSDESSKWISKPLSIINARRLETRSENTWETAKYRSSMTKSEKCSTPSSQFQGIPLADNVSKGWHASSPAHANAHNRLQMMDMHKESKGKNFNPYVFKERFRVQSPLVTDDKSISSQPLPECPDHNTELSVCPHGKSSVWEAHDLSCSPKEESVTRTFEDVTLTDTSRYVLS
jgi:regulation of enolase protein 1 (concanavalin A-like superfamily)